MPNEEWGVKRVCPTTGKRFYDLNRNPVVSPYTGEVVNIETGKKSLMAADAADQANKKAKEEEEAEVNLLDDDDDVDVDIDDDTVLEDEEDDDTVSLDEIADVVSEDDDS